MKWFKAKNGGEQGAFPSSQWSGGNNADQHQQSYTYGKRSEPENNGGSRLGEIESIVRNGTGDETDTLPSQEDIEVTTGCFGPTKQFNYCNKSNKKKKSRNPSDQQHGEQDCYDGYDQDQQ